MVRMQLMEKEEEEAEEEVEVGLDSKMRSEI
jgi:hypothetical protein